jgi:hypothetical protein
MLFLLSFSVIYIYFHNMTVFWSQIIAAGSYQRIEDAETLDQEYQLFQPAGTIKFPLEVLCSRKNISPTSHKLRFVLSQITRLGHLEYWNLNVHCRLSIHISKLVRSCMNIEISDQFQIFITRILYLPYIEIWSVQEHPPNMFFTLLTILS